MQRWSRGHKPRGQGQAHTKNPRPRPRTDFPRTDPLEAKDRNTRGQGLGPRSQLASVFQKKLIKKGLRAKIANFPQKFRRSARKSLRAENCKFFAKFKTKKKKGHNLGPFLINQKIVLSSTEDRAFLRNLEASKLSPRTRPLRSRPTTSK